MSELTSEIADEVVAACQAGAEEAAEALSRSLDGKFTLTAAESGSSESYRGDSTPEGFDGAGLAVLLKFGDVGFAALLPESSGLLPDWYADPDPTGESKLSTLAQELSMLLVPETLIADSFAATRVEQLGAAVSAAGAAEDATLVSLQIASGGSSAQLSLIWPLASPDSLLPAEEVPEETPEKTTNAPPTGSSIDNTPMTDSVQNFTGLPPYSQSLLKVKVPVHVVLATKKELLGEIVELAPGTIIKFEKSCEEMLQLYVGNQEVAEGEAIKIGDKFGFRVSSIQMPHEHFMKIPPRSAG